MSYTLGNLYAVAARVLRQLSHDRRFLVLSLVLPVAVVIMLYMFFDGVEVPIFNPKKFVVPVGAFIVHFIAYALCAIALVRERTLQTLGRMFVNGYRQVEIIGGYLLAYSTLATLQSLIVLMLLNVLFKLNYSVGTFASIYAVIWLLAIISILMGIFVSNFARNEGQVFPFIPLVILFSVFFSGVILPVENLGWASILSYVTPLYYVNIVIQELIASSGALVNTWGSLAGLLIFGSAVLMLATLTLREVE